MPHCCGSPNREYSSHFFLRRDSLSARHCDVSTCSRNRAPSVIHFMHAMHCHSPSRSIVKVPCAQQRTRADRATSRTTWPSSRKTIAAPQTNSARISRSPGLTVTTRAGTLSRRPTSNSRALRKFSFPPAAKRTRLVHSGELKIRLGQALPRSGLGVQPGAPELQSRATTCFIFSREAAQEWLTVKRRPPAPFEGCE
jgi:hypothetical protein